jgi:HK97 family phage major capsid protein
MDFELKAALDGLQGETKMILSGLAAKHAELEKKNRDMQAQIDAIDMQSRERNNGGSGAKGIEDLLKENDGVQRLLVDKKGSAIINFSGESARVFERKTAITESAAGSMTSGVMQIDRVAGVTAEARQRLTVRGVLYSRPTNMQVVDFVKVNTPMAKASPQVEALDKFENSVTFVSASEKIRTIATWVPATKQILDDFQELAGFIQTSLLYYVNLSEEIQLLSGDGTGENLHGLITQAAVFNPALLSPSKGWNKIDIVLRTKQQIAIAKELQPTFIVMHPTDWYDIQATKDGFGRYLIGDPQSSATPRMWDLDVVPTTSIPAGTFLMGSGLPEASEIRDRMEAQVEISTQHSDYFVKNLVAVRCEKRLALVTKRVNSYITGSFTSSPA